MEALKTAAFTPLSVLSKRSDEPRKSFSLTPFRKSSTHGFPLSGSLLLLQSLTIPDLATALSYDEALQQTVNTTETLDFDIAGIFNSLAAFAADNPIVIAGGVAVLAVPLLVAQLTSGKPRAWGAVNAKTAYEKLGDDGDAQLLDIRAPTEIRQAGSPDIRGLRKRPVAVGFDREDKSAFLNRLALRFKEPENTTLFVLDRFDGNSELVAELVTANGFKAAYAIRDGAQGSRGWLNSGLPWILPKKAFSFDPSRLFDVISDTFGVASDAVPLILGAAVAAVVGLVTYTEVESVLQLLGSIAVAQFVTQKVVSGEERKRTSQQIEAFVSTEIAPKDLPGDIQQIGRAFLPFPATSKALPPTTEAIPDVQTKVEAVPEPSPVVNSILVAEVQEGSLAGFPRPLSPYPNYPDYKPPSSPMPSQP